MKRPVISTFKKYSFVLYVEQVRGEVRPVEDDGGRRAGGLWEKPWSRGLLCSSGEAARGHLAFDGLPW